jgi:hypothetical protein
MKKTEFASMRACAALAISVFAVCASLCAQSQFNTEILTGTNPGQGAVDVSVHSEVDGQPHEPAPAEDQRQRLPTSLGAKQTPASVFWPAQAGISALGSEDKSASPSGNLSPLRRGIGSGNIITQHLRAPAESINARNDNSGRGLPNLSNDNFPHFYYGGTARSVGLGPYTSALSEADKISWTSPVFGPSHSSPAVTENPLQVREFSVRGRQSVKQHRKSAQKSGKQSP